MGKQLHFGRILLIFFALLGTTVGRTNAPASAQTNATVAPTSGDKKTITLSGSPPSAAFGVFAHYQGPDVDGNIMKFTCLVPSGVICLIEGQSGPVGFSMGDSGSDTGDAGARITVSVPLTFAVKAQAGSASYTFTLTAVSPAPPPQTGKAMPPVLTIVSGNNQTVAPAFFGGSTDFAPLTVLLASQGKPIANSPVVFACPKYGTPLGCALNTAGARSLTIQTDANGRATLAGYGGRSVRAFGSTATAITVTSGASVVVFVLN